MMNLYHDHCKNKPSFKGYYKVSSFHEQYKIHRNTKYPNFFIRRDATRARRTTLRALSALDPLEIIGACPQIIYFGHLKSCPTENLFW